MSLKSLDFPLFIMPTHDFSWGRLSPTSILKSNLASVAFSPDGKKLAIVGGNKLSVWDITEVSVLGPVRSEQSGVKPPMLFVVELGAKEWELTKVLELLQRYRDNKTNCRPPIDKKTNRRPPLENCRTAVAFSRDGSKLATCGIFARLWDAQSGELLTTQRISWKPTREGGYRDESAIAIAFSPDGKGLTIGGQRTVRCWNAETQEISTLCRIEGKSEAIDEYRGFAFSPNGELCLTGTTSSHAELWHIRDKVRLWQSPNRFSGHPWAISPDGKLLVVGCQVYDLRSGATRTIWRGEPNCLALAPDGATIACGWPFYQGEYNGPTVDFWNAQTLNQKAISYGRHFNDRGRDMFVFSPDSRILVTVRQDCHAINLWEVD